MKATSETAENESEKQPQTGKFTHFSVQGVKWTPFLITGISMTSFFCYDSYQLQRKNMHCLRCICCLHQGRLGP